MALEHLQRHQKSICDAKYDLRQDSSEFHFQPKALELNPSQT